MSNKRCVSQTGFVTVQAVENKQTLLQLPDANVESVWSSPVHRSMKQSQQQVVVQGLYSKRGNQTGGWGWGGGKMSKSPPTLTPSLCCHFFDHSESQVDRKRLGGVFISTEWGCDVCVAAQTQRCKGFSASGVFSVRAHGIDKEGGHFSWHH